MISEQRGSNQVNVRYVTCAAVAGVAEEEAGAMKCGRWLVFFVLFQILKPIQ
jgi:hypothetical protein